MHLFRKVMLFLRGYLIFKGYVTFKNRKRFAEIQNISPTTHIERAWGSIEENISYYSTDSSFKGFEVHPSITEGTNAFSNIIARARRKRLI